MSGNVVYKTDQIARYFAHHRVRWDDFYPSERWVFERVGSDRRGFGKVLDVGCAAGGLGLALNERFPLTSYFGVDINDPAIEVARARRATYRVPAKFHAGDILDLGTLDDEPFDTVVNLSCADWNIDTQAIIDASWNRLAAGGRFVISLRLTNGEGVNDITRSYQPIRLLDDAPDACERANYVVFNVHEALALLGNLRPQAAHILGYGYWGPPSRTAVTVHDRLLFAVFAVTKGTVSATEVTTELHFPLSIWQT